MTTSYSAALLPVASPIQPQSFKSAAWNARPQVAHQQDPSSTAPIPPPAPAPTSAHSPGEKLTDRKGQVLDLLLAHLGDYTMAYLWFFDNPQSPDDIRAHFKDAEGCIRGRCPLRWHARKDALQVTTVGKFTGRFRCWSCKTRGDLFDLLRATRSKDQGRKVSFSEVLAFVVGAILGLPGGAEGLPDGLMGAYRAELARPVKIIPEPVTSVRIDRPQVKPKKIPVRDLVLRILKSGPASTRDIRTAIKGRNVAISAALAGLEAEGLTVRTAEHRRKGADLWALTMVQNALPDGHPTA